MTAGGIRNIESGKRGRDTVPAHTERAGLVHLVVGGCVFAVRATWEHVLSGRRPEWNHGVGDRPGILKSPARSSPYGLTATIPLTSSGPAASKLPQTLHLRYVNRQSASSSPPPPNMYGEPENRGLIPTMYYRTIARGPRERGNTNLEEFPYVLPTLGL